MSSTERSADRPSELDGLATQVAREAARSRLFGRPNTPVKIGRHMVIEPVGSGAMGVVYAAYDPNLDRKIAVKVVLSGEGADDDRQARLAREAQALAKLSHPNVVHVYDTGTHEGDVYIAMEFVEGHPLTTWIEQGLHPWREVVQIFLEAGRGLAAAHGAGLVHRDFKPDNVFVCSDGRVVVLDFGLSRGRLEHEPGDSDEASLRSAELEQVSADLTETGTVLGTPAYMSPEQFAGATADAKSDQFAFCVALFEALYGARPFEGNTITSLAANVLEGRLRDVTPPRPVPGWLRTACLRGLRTDPDGRFDRLDDLLEILGRRRTSPTGRLAQVGLLGAGAAIAMFLFGDDDELPPCLFEDLPWAGSWDATGRERVRAAFAATEASYADFAWTKVADRIDAFTAAWETMRVETCETTHVHGTQSSDLLDRKMACLARRQDEVRVVAQLLQDADVTVVRNATELLDELGPLSRCADTEYLQARVRPPEDPEVAASVEDVRHRLTQVRSRRIAGRAESALPIAHSAYDEAERLAYGPLQAEAAFALGDIQEARGQLEEARNLYVRAFWNASDTGHDEMLYQVANDLAYLLGVSMSDTEAALQWLRHAESALSRGSGGEADKTYVRATRASLRLQAGESEAAREALEEIVFELEGTDAEPSKLAAAYTNLGAAYSRIERNDEAAAAHERAAETAVQAFGTDHPEHSKALANRAASLDAAGNTELAAEVLGQALRINRRAYPGGHISTGFMLTTLGTIAVHRDDFADACRQFERAHAVLLALTDANPRLLGMLLSNWADALAKKGDRSEAERRYREAIELDRNALGPDHSERGWALHGLGSMFLADESYPAAIELLEEAHRVRSSPDVPASQLGATELLLARALWRAGTDRPRARTLATSARQRLDLPGEGTIEDWLQRDD